MVASDGRRAGGRGDDSSAGWAAPFLPDDDAGGPTDEPIGGRRAAPPPPYGAAMNQGRVAWYVPLIGRMLTLFAIGMIAFALFAAVAGLGKEASLPPKVMIQPITSANPIVRIDHTAGNIRIQPGVSGEVRVVANTTARHLSRGLAEQSLREAQVELLPERNGVIQLNSSPDGAWGFAFERDHDILVSIPPGATLELKVQAGNATVAQHSGRIIAEVSAGSLDLAGVKIEDGSRVQVSAGHARLDGELLPDASLDVRVSAGNATIELPYNTDARLNATASSGYLDINPNDWAGAPGTTVRRGDVTAIQGPLYLDQNPKSTITINVTAGNATLRPRSSNSAPPSLPNPPARPNAPAPPPAPGR